MDQYREGQLSTTLTSKQKLSLPKILRKNRPSIAIGGTPLEKIRGHDIELYVCSKDIVFEITKERRDAYKRIKHQLTNAPFLILPDFKLPFKLYINAACGQGLGEALHQRQIVDGEPSKGVICSISRQLKDSDARYGATKTGSLRLVWVLEKLHYFLEGPAFEFYTDCTALKSLLNMKTTNRHIFRWQIAIQEYRGNVTIIYKEGKSHTNADGH
ncbi:hypothetical protein O181_009010 [Austropuccinia psidii MF-1]|uniref:Reverse transcriptase RNase H-like domain-containing protein n=1 Tax=Austropuccinia psidii MF-1 TaxID=1389203 RepID=A0A9Q3BQG8_9BASI|nr:hypothetical protein [Austropuccinia psidii MF-1]